MSNKKIKTDIEEILPDQSQSDVVVEEQPAEVVVAPEEEINSPEIEKVVALTKADVKAMRVDKKSKFLSLLNINLKHQIAKLASLDVAIKEILACENLTNQEKQEEILCDTAKVLSAELEIRKYECARKCCLDKIHYLEAKIYELEKDIKIADAPWDIEIKKTIKGK